MWITVSLYVRSAKLMLAVPLADMFDVKRAILWCADGWTHRAPLLWTLNFDVINNPSLFGDTLN